MAKIFLSHRRQDSAAVAGRIYDRLRAHFGDDAVFMDIDSIPFGEDFREHIDAVVGKCDVVLAVFGPRWSGKTDASRRIDDPMRPCFIPSVLTDRRARFPLSDSCEGEGVYSTPPTPSACRGYSFM
jgi:TIR domain-containing protein